MELQLAFVKAPLKFIWGSRSEWVTNRRDQLATAAMLSLFDWVTHDFFRASFVLILSFDGSYLAPTSPGAAKDSVLKIIFGPNPDAL